MASKRSKHRMRWARELILAGILALLTAPLPALTTQEPPTINESLLLGGSGYVTIGHDSALNPTFAITVEAWVRRNNDTRCETVVAKGYLSSWWLGFCNEKIRFYGSGSGSLQDGNTSIPAHVWTHIAVVYRSGAPREYYINGELDYVGPAAESAPTGNTSPVQIGRDPAGCCLFDGRIAHVRIWHVPRSQDQIRRYMHVAIDEALPGLVASWRLAGPTHGAYGDPVGGHDGTAVGSAGFNAIHGSPAQTLSMEVDADFNLLPTNRHGQATAYLPDRDQALLIGGVRSTLSAGIDRVDAVTGAFTPEVGSLPVSLTQLSAAYVPSNDQVYTFGGSTSTNFSANGVTRIFAINATTGASREVLPGLPQALSGLTAVYHPEHHKIYLFGGRVDGAAVDTVYVFDPDTEQVSPGVGMSLPAGRSHMGGVYSPLDGRIYLFGGFAAVTTPADATDTIWQVLIPENGSTGQVVQLGRRLTGPDALVQGAFDPGTGLIYLLAGTGSYWISAFDPFTHRTWRTRMALPRLRTGASVMISPASRHALIVGGNGAGSLRNVWRVPLGRGPAVPIGDWRFPSPVSSQPTTIHGSGRGVAIGTIGHGAYRVRADLAARANYSAANLGSAHANDVRYEPVNDHVWISTQTAGGRLRGSQSINYGSALLGTNQLRSVDIRPGYASTDSAPYFGTQGQGMAFRRFVLGSNSWVWESAFAGTSVTSIRHRQANDVWAIANGTLRRLQISTLGTTESNFGAPCNLTGFRDLNFAANGDWWLAADDGEFGGGVCRIPAATTPGQGSTLVPNLGTRAQRISSDRDGRVWVAIRQDGLSSGGLAAFEHSGGNLRTTEFNWQNAALGSLTPVIVSPTQRRWDSGVSAVGAVEESVWVGKTDGRLITHTPRWRRIDDAHDIRFYDIRRIGFARGHAFLGGEWGFHVMSPDGVTWDTRFDFGFRDVLGDRSGRIWMATSAGVRRYRSWGFEDLSDREGVRPTWPLHALAEDQQGRIWIGGDNGLTLYDRERFVATFNAANSDLPANQVRALFVDSGNRLWIGTSNGLARLDGDRFTVFTTANGLPGNEIFAIDQIGSGEVVVSTTNSAGIAVFNGTAFNALPTPYTAGQYPISVDQEGRLWAGRAMRLENQWIQHHTTNSGLVSQTVHAQAADLGDRIWFAHGANGVSVRGSTLPPLSNVVPVITSVSRLSGSAGDDVVITGTGFTNGGTGGGARVFIGNGEARVGGITATQIRARLTPENTSGDIVVQVGGRRTIWSQKFCAIPTISHFTPTGGNLGMQVTVHGSNFDRNVGHSAGGPERQASAGPDQFRFNISNHDTSGPLVVRNLSQGCNQTATSERSFQRFEVAFDRVMLNQGHKSLGLAGNKPTVVQHYLTTDRWIRAAEGFDDRLEIDRLRLRFTQAGQPPRVFNIPIETRPPTWPPPWALPSNPPASTFTLPRAWYQDLEMSLHATVTPWVEGGAPVEVESTLLKNEVVVAQNTRTVDMRRSDVLNVLLVPIMANDYTQAELTEMRNMTNASLDDARQRLFPFGRVNFHWAPSVVRANDVLWDTNEQVDVMDSFELYMASHSLERARRSWNSNNSLPKATVAYGVVQPRANSNPSAGGLAFWPDMSALINAMGLGALDALCEFTDAVVEFFSLGLLGGDGCDIAVPLYVGWSVATDRSSRLIGHEVGHILGLVRSHAANGSTLYNPSHSINDEIFGQKTCTDFRSDSPGFFSPARTLYRSPGFEGPVINPLIGQQFLPALSEEATRTFNDVEITSGAFVERGKAIMSYACGRGDRNVFFEPSDVSHMRFEVDPFVLGLTTASTQLARSSQGSGHGVRTRSIAGRRILVSGQVDRAEPDGLLVEVVALGDQGPLDASYETGWTLIQRDAAGIELARSGIFPVFMASEGHSHGRDSGTQESDLGFFAATLLAANGVARIDLVHQGAVLDSFNAGPGIPSVNLTSPTVGSSYATGTVPVTWTASDPDGDALMIRIEYSADNGANWVPVEFSEGSGSVAVPVSVLAASTQARMRVVASDGLHIGSATSATFTVQAQAPAAFIGAPDDGAVYLEGQRIRLSGGAWDAGTLAFDESGLHWASSRDGDLGQGAVLKSMLSVGTHLITLEASNVHGLTSTASINLIVRGDYDGDGVADDDELALGFNPLFSHDVWVDEDGDGLPWIMEDRWGTDPTNSDTSGSGSSDAEDIGDGLDPLDASDTLPANILAVSPPSIQFVDDRSLGTLPPHERLQVSSHQAAGWTVSTNRAWLMPLRSSGNTPDTISVRADSTGLPDGNHTAVLSFSSSAGNVQVPVTLTVLGSSVPVEDTIFQDRFQALVDRLFR